MAKLNMNVIKVTFCNDDESTNFEKWVFSEIEVSYPKRVVKQDTSTLDYFESAVNGYVAFNILNTIDWNSKTYIHAKNTESIKSKLNGYMNMVNGDKDFERINTCAKLMASFIYPLRNKVDGNTRSTGLIVGTIKLYNQICVYCDKYDGIESWDKPRKEYVSALKTECNKYLAFLNGEEDDFCKKFDFQISAKDFNEITARFYQHYDKSGKKGIVRESEKDFMKYMISTVFALEKKKSANVKYENSMK